MKRTNLLKLLCLTIGLVMLVSALPISAAAPLVGDTVTAPAPTVSEGHIDVVLRDFGTAGQKPDVSAHVTDAVSFTFSNYARAKADGTNNVLGLVAGATKTGLTINDLKGDSLMNGFVFSADYKFGSDYITGVADSDISSCVQLLEFQTGFQKIVRLGHDGRIFVTLVSGNPVIPGVKISADKWFNFKVEMIPQSSTKFTYYIYVNDVLVYTADLTKTPSQTAISYRVLAEDKVVGNACMIDNIQFRTLPFIPNPNRVDTTIDFENCDPSIFTDGYFVNEERLADYCNTPKTTASTSWVGNSKMNSSIVTATDTAYNRVWQNASSRAHFVVTDKENRLIDRDFTVSADMMFKVLPVNTTPLVQWLRGSVLTSAKSHELVSIDPNGNIKQGNTELGAKVAAGQWFNITLRVSYVAHNLYQVAIYLDEELISANEMTIACSSSATEGSHIRFFSSAGVTGVDKFTAQLDNIQIYESDNIKITEKKDVIWNLNFNGLSDNTQPNISTLRSFSEGYEAVRNLMGSTAVVSNERLKISAALNKWVDIKLGKGTDDPVKEGPVSISFKFNLESKTTAPTANHRIIGIRRTAGIPENANGKTIDVVNLINNDLYFFGTKVMSSIELNRDYDIKAVVDGRKNIASLYIDGNKVIDSLSVAYKSTAVLGEGLSFVTDDAGNKHYLPYTGFVYQQKYDANGEAIADTYVKRFVQSIGHGVDMLRLFQTGTAEPTGLVYYVDDFKVERIETDSTIYSTDFTGWSNITDKNPNTLNSSTYSYVSFADSSPKNPTIEKDEKGNEYLYCTGIERMFIADRRFESMYKEVELSYDMLYTQLDAPGGTGKTGILNLFFGEPSTNNPFNYNATMNNVLMADEIGNLYNLGNEKIAENIDGKWMNIKIVIKGDGTKWTEFEYYVDGKYAGTVAAGKSISDQKDYVIRFIPNNRCELFIDNITYKFVEPTIETADFLLDFDEDYEAMLSIMASEFRYPKIDSTRTDAAGNTVTRAQVLDENGDKFLRIDRTLLAADEDGYITADNLKYINGNEYIVETDFRFNCNAGFGITPLTLIAEKGAGQFAPVEVKGAYNTLSVTIRGSRYDLYSSAGKLLNVNTTEDEGFTKLAILVNDNAGTYTVYVNERIAYYLYDGEYLPCANLPIIYNETGVETSAGASLKLMEVNRIRHNYSIIDIDRIAIIPAASGIASSFKATQSRVDATAGNFDLRFIAGIDSLYGNSVGFEIVATYTDGTQKTVEKEFKSNIVFSSIVNEEETILATDLGSAYIFAMAVEELPVNVGDVNFKITPFVEHGGIRSFGATESITASCDGTTVTIK